MPEATRVTCITQALGRIYEIYKCTTRARASLRIPISRCASSLPRRISRPKLGVYTSLTCLLYVCWPPLPNINFRAINYSAKIPIITLRMDNKRTYCNNTRINQANSRKTFAVLGNTWDKNYGTVAGAHVNSLSPRGSGFYLQFPWRSFRVYVRAEKPLTSKINEQFFTFRS